MFKKKTLLIIGAGASCEAELPSGNELKSTIAGLLNIQISDFSRPMGGDKLICEALRIKTQQTDSSSGSLSLLSSYIDAAQKIRGAMPLASSIDSFIDAHSGDESVERCGKLAIVRSILTAESRSKLYFVNKGYGSNIDYTSVQNTWFTKFYQVLTEGCRKDDLAERLDSLAMVIFNYDRCVEHFLVNSIKKYYKIEAADAADLVNRIEIYHPYGKVGHLPWQQRDESIDFGAEPRVEQLLSISEQIRTFTEGTDPDSSEIFAIRKQIKTSEIVLFLGFAFHEINMELLQLGCDDGPKVSGRQCFATAKGISLHNCDIIEAELLKLKSLKEENLYISSSLSCVDLFEEFSRSLSFA